MESNDGRADRDRGIFTPTDRELLLEDKLESGTQRERNVRMRLRKRLENALMDFTIALEQMEHRDLNEVINGERSDDEQKRLDEGIVSAIGLIYWATERNAPPRDFETLLEHGIRRSVAARHRDAEGKIRGYVDVDFEVREEVYNIDDLYQRFQDPRTGDMLDGYELGMLRKEDLITSDEIGAYHEATLDSTIQDRGGGFVSEEEVSNRLEEWQSEGTDNTDDKDK